MMVSLPDGLPPGRFLSFGPVRVWVSDEFPQDVEQLCRRLLSEHRAHGLVPLLCWPEEIGRPLSLEDVEAVRLEEVLAADFVEYRRRRLPFWTDRALDPVPEGVEAWPHDPGPPYSRWPGLAPGQPVTVMSPAPEEAASSTIAELVAMGHLGLDECRLFLVPTTRSSDAMALLGWSAEAPLPLLCALLRSWEDRFGAQAVAVLGSELHVSVARPPAKAEHAQLLALEHVLSTADNIVDDPPRPFPEYAAALVGRTHWSFWWDYRGIRTRGSFASPLPGKQPRCGAVRHGSRA